MDQFRSENADKWLASIFAAKAVQRGGVVRRFVSWVEHEIGRDAFVAEVQRRDFRLFEVGGQFIVICNSAPLRRLV